MVPLVNVLLPSANIYHKERCLSFWHFLLLDIYLVIAINFINVVAFYFYIILGNIFRKVKLEQNAQIFLNALFARAIYIY